MRSCESSASWTVDKGAGGASRGGEGRALRGGANEDKLRGRCTLGVAAEWKHRAADSGNRGLATPCRENQRASSPYGAWVCQRPEGPAPGFREQLDHCLSEGKRPTCQLGNTAALAPACWSVKRG